MDILPVTEMEGRLRAYVAIGDTHAGGKNIYWVEKFQYSTREHINGWDKCACTHARACTHGGIGEYNYL